MQAMERLAKEAATFRDIIIRAGIRNYRVAATNESGPALVGAIIGATGGLHWLSQLLRATRWRSSSRQPDFNS